MKKAEIQWAANFIKAYMISGELMKKPEENSDTWLFRVRQRVLNEVNADYCQYKKAVKVNPVRYAQCMPYIVYMWMAIACVAEENGLLAYKYWDVHKRCKEALYHLQSPLRIILSEDISGVWSLLEEGARIINTYQRKGEFVDYNPKILEVELLGF